ncbi:MAG: MBL fold metallo-hydrolase [Eubacterium sp.]|nr:MBL fold metallo-hydrolase [Eubacterium sp.]
MDVTNITVNTQSSILIDCGKKIYVDPLEIDGENHDADYVFITHDHYDHFSEKDILKIINENTVFIAPKAMEAKLIMKTPVGTQIIVEPGNEYETDDFTFETVASYNKVKPFHPKRSGWCGYILNIDGKRIYIAGDTDATKEAESVDCDIALIPIGGTYTMNYKEAAKLINKMKPKVVIPTHYGAIVGNKSDGQDFEKLVDSGIQVVLKL